ncbi:hypothetical protein [Qipengyuania gelatinilytica]|uniref:Uncharacterized protein n=1 Tax=Qipengyuania gelatinilytica TaxID=2867231 RepID=A0ABX9A107_9SPHN|nr:hypothetical protein [Qipengyuania gelatinilytica]QZD94752.1 hypothetical protein K3136_11780 [Qipengyuania gelatinilytica]
MKNVFWIICALGLALLAYDLVWSKWEHTDDSMLATGMPPQIALIEDIVSEHGWAIDCRGRSGDMTVVRLAPGWWPSKSSPDEVRDAAWAAATSVTPSVDLKEKRDGCDLPANNYGVKIDENDDPIVYGVGPRDVLELYLKEARECGVKGARLGPATPEQQIAIAGETSPDWMGLIIDPKLESRYGPLNCMVVMSERKQAELRLRE